MAEGPELRGGSLNTPPLNSRPTRAILTAPFVLCVALRDEAHCASRIALRAFVPELRVKDHRSLTTNHRSLTTKNEPTNDTRRADKKRADTQHEKKTRKCDTKAEQKRKCKQQVQSAKKLQAERQSKSRVLSLSAKA